MYPQIPTMGRGDVRTPTKHVSAKGNVTWRVKYRVPARDGGRDGSTSQVFPTRQLAEKFASLLDAVGPTRALEQTDETLRRDSSPRLDDLFEEFLDWKAGRVRSDRTVHDYRRDWRNWISPALGDRRASAVGEVDVQRLVDEMARQLSPKSVADRHALLHALYKWASAPSRRRVDHDPCTETDLPRRRKTQPKGLRPNEWLALHAALKTVDPDAADLAEFLLASAWRWSEAAALDVFDVEDDGSSVHVSMGQTLRRNAAGEHVVVVDAKSDAGLRRIRLDSDAAELVRRRVGSRTSGLVFANKAGRQWHYANFLNRAWTPAVDAANLSRRPSPHWLRHTAVAWLVLSGKVSLPELQRRIGHEHISTTIDVYGRLIDDVSEDALKAFAAMRLPKEIES